MAPLLKRMMRDTERAKTAFFTPAPGPALEINEEAGAYNRDDPKSLINLLSPGMQNHLEATQNFFLNDLSEYSVKKNISHMQEFPLLQKLRQAFWLEHTRVMDHGKNRMEMTRVWQGIMSNGGEFYALMKRPEFAAYIFTQPASMEVKNHVLADLGYQRILEIMSVSAIKKARDKAGHILKDQDGKDVEIVDGQLAKVQLEIWKHADERLQGGTIKKVHVSSEQKNLNVNVDASEVTHKIDATQFNKLEDIQKRIAELRSKVTNDTFDTSYTVEEAEEEDAD